MRLKKLICTILSLSLIAPAAACGASTGAVTGSTAQEEVTQDTASPSSEEAPSAEGEAAPAAEASPAEASPAEPAAPAASAPAEEIAAADISVIWEDSHIYYDLTLGHYKSVVTYGVKGYEDVPFIMASDYLSLLYDGKERITNEDGVMKITLNGTNAVIDPSADTVSFENPSRFRSEGEVDGAIVDRTEYNVVTPSSKNESVQTKAGPLTISLKDYHMPVIAYEDGVLMPFLALQNTFGSICMVTNLAYNGRDYYNVFEAYNYYSDPEYAGSAESPYVKGIYNGPFSEKTETTEPYAQYAYYSTCLLLDLTFGHKQEKNITTFDEYFTRMNAKEAMCSTKPSVAVAAEFMLFNYLFDSGHDAFFSSESVFGKIEQPSQEEIGGIVDGIKESEEGKELFENAEGDEAAAARSDEELTIDVILGALMEKGFKIPEIAPLYIWTMFFEANRPADYGSQRIDFAGDTAVIYFDAFKDDSTYRNPSYYLDPVKEEDYETSSFAFFYHCFEEIGQHDEVKNVVLNISDNGGGSATSLISILGFLSPDGEVRITNLDLPANSYREECYHVDTNIDGIADDEDGYGGQYDFYIMCSGSSYSCGNALPYFAQKEGLAKIIGTKPGGGDCVVGYFIDAYGRCGFYSGMLKLGTDDGTGFVSDEKATTVDLNMMPSLFDIHSVPWYDPEGIADAVHQYRNGVTEISYEPESQEEEEVGIDEILQLLFEWLAETEDSAASTN